jgi:tyrosinase
METSTRRQFLAISGAALVAGAFGRQAVAAGTVGVRKDITKLSAGEIGDFREAVKRMHALPAADVRNWEMQAKIHRTTCPHGNWFFLPWHRAYLWYFERICRGVLGKPGFMLPYWNWTTTPQIPGDFWGAGNPLLDANRDITAADGVPGEFVGRTVIDDIMAIPDFITFGSGPANALHPMPPVFDEGQLESIPHDNVHGFIGGDMGNVPTSALDPIFWMHHANLDRIWAEWSQSHNNPSDATWKNLAMPFVDENGAASTSTPGDLVDSTVLGYRYDTQPAMPPAIAFAAVAPVSAVPKNLVAMAAMDVGPRTPKPVAWSADAPDGLKAALSNLPINPEKPRPATFRLTIEGVQRPDDPKPVSVRVYLNCDYLTPQTPISDPHYVGTFTFFGDGHGGDGAAHQNDNAARIFDATRVCRRLYGGRDYPRDDVKVSLVTIDSRTQQPKDYHLAAKKVTLSAIK